MKSITRPAAVVTAALLAAATLAAAPNLLRAQQSAPPADSVAEAPAAATALDDRATLLADLERTRSLFLAAIDGLSEAQWNWRPAPDRWSVGECAEHITRTEAALRGAIAGVASGPVDAEMLAKSHGKVAAIREKLVDRSFKAQAPEPLNPMQAGDVRPAAAIVGDFNFERGRVYELATSADLLGRAAMNPVVGELDLLGWIYFLSGHVERHTLQIEEVKASEGYPAR